ncbi:hypothetical protein IWZ03DRAFT_9063 [Phyllosticta citriasiana]|uniref:Uncharacterized protein n=1 Tax=Phyllosticta citriasiana TaxID=595635 RepID=A0ABR1L235_9PEZI
MFPHRTNKGVVKNALSGTSQPSAHARSIGGWGRNRWPRWRADPFDEEWRHFEQRMERFRQEIDKDPYEAIFGWSNRMRQGESPSPGLRPCRRSSPVTDAPAESSHEAGQNQSLPTRDGQDAPIPTQQASAYVSPIQSTTSSPNKSASNFEYDPISGRMVEKAPQEDAPQAETETRTNQVTSESATPSQESTSAAADSRDETCASYDASKAYRDPRDDALKAFDAKQKKQTITRLDDWYARQGLDPPPPKENVTKRRSVNAPWTKPQHNPAKPFTPAESVDTPFGPISRNTLPEDDIDLLTAEDIRSRMRRIGRVPYQERSPAQKRQEQLHQEFTKIQNSDSFVDEDGSKIEAPVSNPPRGFARRLEKTTEDQRNQAKSEAVSELETAPSRHLKSGRRPSVDDGYSHEPIGLQTSYQREKAAGRDLAAEIAAKEEMEQFDDGYSRRPTGLQTSFERERRSGKSLEDELQARTEPGSQPREDGYSKTPMGLETSYQREIESGKSLEDEIRARTQSESMPDDGYSKDPTGLQSSYAREMEAVRKGEKKSLAEELQEAPTGAGSYSDVCTSKMEFFATPKSIEQRRKDASPDVAKDWYGYSLQPLGLETSYERELEDCKNGKRKTLEQELKERYSATQKEVSTGAHDSKASSREERGVLNNINGLLSDAALSRTLREVYEKHYGKITYDHRQPLTPLPASAQPENEGRVDESIHQSLVEHEAKNPDKYKFKPDNLEAELAAQNPIPEKHDPPTEAREENFPHPVSSVQGGTDASSEAASASNESSSKGQVRYYKLLAYDRSARTVETSETTSTVRSSGETPISLSVALSKLANPVKFLPHLKQLGKEGYEPVASTGNLLVLRLREGHPSPSESVRAKPLRANPVDGTTIPLPPTPTTMSPTGYVNLDPVVDQDSRSEAFDSALQNRSASDPASWPSRSFGNVDRHHRGSSGKKVRRTEAVFTGQQRARAEQEKHNRRQGVRTVLTTLIWATATCYIAGVAGEVAKGY